MEVSTAGTPEAEKVVAFFTTAVSRVLRARVAADFSLGFQYSGAGQLLTGSTGATCARTERIVESVTKATTGREHMDPTSGRADVPALGLDL
jgi:hypothetical protein